MIFGGDVSLWQWNVDGSQPKLMQCNIATLDGLILRASIDRPVKARQRNKVESHTSNLSMNKASTSFRVVGPESSRSLCQYLRTVSRMKSNLLHTVFMTRTIELERWCSKAIPNDTSAGLASTLDKRRVSVILHRATSSKGLSLLWTNNKQSVPKFWINFQITSYHLSKVNGRYGNHREKIGSIAYFPPRTDVLCLDMRLSNLALNLFCFFLLDLHSWVWWSIPLPVEDIFDANYLFTAWDSRRKVSVSPQNWCFCFWW